LLDTLAGTPQRGWHVHNGRLFVVAGARVYEVYADGSSREWGKINSVRDRVSMASLLNVIVIGDGAGYYALDLDAGTVAAIADAPRGGSGVLQPAHFIPGRERAGLSIPS
jgi:hypothetical protein